MRGRSFLAENESKESSTRQTLIQDKACAGGAGEVRTWSSPMWVRRCCPFTSTIQPRLSAPSGTRKRPAQLRGCPPQAFIVLTELRLLFFRIPAKSRQYTWRNPRISTWAPRKCFAVKFQNVFKGLRNFPIPKCIFSKQMYIVHTSIP